MIRIVFLIFTGAFALTKILADFLFGFYLLNFVLNHATNHTKKRWL